MRLAMTQRRTPWICLAVLALLAGACRRLDRVMVQGVSMAPALLPGDRLLVLRTRRVRVGDLVVARDPREPARELVKRLVEITPQGELVCHGDNAESSTDSRAYGALPAGCLVGRALYRYAPPARSGLMRSGAVRGRRR
ncbi:MAG: nickel-type superoxide dismutase maturation protease [Egibacteraceae bacterium]